MKYCPCGTGKRFLECCGQFLQMKLYAATPEELMRSRYTAFVENRMDYIRKTMRGPALQEFNKKPKDKLKDRPPIQWLGLEVIKAYLDPTQTTVGYVEFIARYKMEHQEFKIHELSEFHLMDGRWYYVDGKQDNNLAERTEISAVCNKNR